MDWQQLRAEVIGNCNVRPQMAKIIGTDNVPKSSASAEAELCPVNWGPKLGHPSPGQKCYLDGASSTPWLMAAGKTPHGVMRPIVGMPLCMVVIYATQWLSSGSK